MSYINIVIFIIFLLLGGQARIGGVIAPNSILWPQPIQFTADNQTRPLHTSPCGINFTIQAVPPSPAARQILDLYLIQVFHCEKVKSNNINMIIIISNSSVMVPTDTKQQAYQLDLKEDMKWTMKAKYYPGFLRALQTFSQLFQKNNNQSPQLKYTVNSLPILIKDEPNFAWRGIMIDSSRHFLPVSAIKHTINGMLFNKLNVLHWHITDQDSFPLEIPSRPQLSAFGKVGGTYTSSDIKSIETYAAMRGIRVVPQIDTPAHTQSWGRSDKLSKITLNCNGIYQGQFDPTLDLTYQVVTDVMKYINSTFTSNYVHFGGDEVVEKCWDQRPQIYQWMQSKNIKTYKDLSIYYRQQQKLKWKEFSKKSVIYWANQQIDLPLQTDDIIHWWGISSNVGKLVGRKNRVILSNYDKTYLDVGFGNRNGNPYQTYITWRTAYEFQPKVPNVSVIGGQSAMWSELSNQHVQDQKIWVRASVIGQRLWNTGIILDSATITNIYQRLQSHVVRLRQRGFKVTPISSGICEKDQKICFEGVNSHQ